MLCAIAKTGQAFVAPKPRRAISRTVSSVMHAGRRCGANTGGNASLRGFLLRVAPSG
jgi:hypothetical protein